MTEETATATQSGPRQWPVARASEIGPGERRFVEVKSHSITLFNVHGEFIAVLNICPHELAPVCKGRVSGTTLPSMPGEFKWGKEGEILACPWHGWEFDLVTGKALADERVRLRRYPVSVVDDVVYLTL
jgi:3-phenylpropionate/trans-cinnamate dioxygenase ferredoxin subunit